MIVFFAQDQVWNVYFWRVSEWGRVSTTHHPQRVALRGATRVIDMFHATSLRWLTRTYASLNLFVYRDNPGPSVLGSALLLHTDTTLKNGHVMCRSAFFAYRPHHDAAP